MNGPTRRNARDGRTRRTSKLPTFRRLPSTIAEIALARIKASFASLAFIDELLEAVLKTCHYLSCYDVLCRLPFGCKLLDGKCILYDHNFVVFRYKDCHTPAEIYTHACL